MAKTKGYQRAPAEQPEDRCRWPTWALDHPHKPPVAAAPAVSPQGTASVPKEPTRAELSAHLDDGLAQVRRVLYILQCTGANVAGPIAAINLCAEHTRDALTTYYPRNITP